jgi:hypothetical protein
VKVALSLLAEAESLTLVARHFPLNSGLSGLFNSSVYKPQEFRQMNHWK